MSQASRPRRISQPQLPSPSSDLRGARRFLSPTPLPAPDESMEFENPAKTQPSSLHISRIDLESLAPTEDGPIQDIPIDGDSGEPGLNLDWKAWHFLAEVMMGSIKPTLLDNSE